MRYINSRFTYLLTYCISARAHIHTRTHTYMAAINSYFQAAISTKPKCTASAERDTCKRVLVHDLAFGHVTGCGRRRGALRDMVHLLLRRGADPNESSVPVSPLIQAVRGGDVDIVRELLLAGADPGVMMPQSVRASNHSCFTEVLTADQLNAVKQKCIEDLIGARAFHVSAPRLWNFLPFNLRQSQTLSSFRRLLKTLTTFSLSIRSLSALLMRSDSFLRLWRYISHLFIYLLTYLFTLIGLASVCSNIGSDH